MCPRHDLNNLHLKPSTLAFDREKHDYDIAELPILQSPSLDSLETQFWQFEIMIHANWKLSASSISYLILLKDATRFIQSRTFAVQIRDSCLFRSL